MSFPNLASQAADMVQSLAEQSSNTRGFGSMSASIYDTAWVSMLRKPGDSYWLFPECFERLLESQHEDGGWESYATQVDGILNTAAGLLAFLKHHNDPVAPKSNLESRITKAEATLRQMLQDWDFESCDHVGFEVLVTRNLDYLEDEGITFDIPVRRSLKVLEMAKLSKLPPGHVEKIPTTLLHSLEALAGKIDFDQMRHLRAHGSMLGSPSSTAAYLMNVSTWDDEAEAYLRAVVGRPTELSAGLVPCAWPTSIFELAWVFTLLNEAGFTTAELGRSALSTIGETLEKTYEKQGGLVGFSAECLPDADDTSRVILALNGLGKTAAPDAMIASLEGADHFLTYQGERNPSFSTNCNVAACLLNQNDPSRYSSQIQKCIQFLCNYAYNKEIDDKWNLSTIYPKMLLSQTLLRFLTCLDNGSLQWGIVPKKLLEEDIPIITCQILTQILDIQEANGSWDSKHELTAYAVLSLIAISSFPWMQPLRSTIVWAIARGKRFLDQVQDQWTTGDYLWIEKVTYSSGTLSLGYCLSAAKATSSSHAWGPVVQHLNNVSTKALRTFGRFFAGVPLFSCSTIEQIQIAYIQGNFFLPGTSRDILNIFPCKDNAMSSYLNYVPFTWTSCNNLAGGILDPLLLQEMMTLSVLIYQADKFMETVVEQEFVDHFDDIRKIVRKLCSAITIDVTNKNDLELTRNGFTDGLDAELDFYEVENTLRKFISYVLTHPRVIISHHRLQKLLSRELEIFLLAHVTHAEDNARFAAQRGVASITTVGQTAVFENPGRTYYQWVRSTSADHTSCPFAFVFYTCLFAPKGIDPFSGPRQAYLAEDLIRHTATMCRQYNDYGSVVRDRLEGNLNSINFPEFHDGVIAGGNIHEEEGILKKSLMQLAEHERAGLELAMAALGRNVGIKTLKAVQLYVNVTDLYGQIYVQRDLTSYK